MREVDFYLFDNEQNSLRCEVKLMGKGNPESADAIFARESDVFVGDKLSDLNKKQAEELNVFWVELRIENGYQRFQELLETKNIPHIPFDGDINQKLDAVLLGLFSN